MARLRACSASAPAVPSGLPDEIRERRDEIREHRGEAGEARLLIGRVLDRLDRLVDNGIADPRKRIERLERH
jgi:hypothetical protein